MKKYIKIIVPPILGVLTSFVLYKYDFSGIVIYRIEFVMNAIITCVTTLAGFILTSLSIIIGMSSSPIMKKIQDEGGMPELVWIYSESLAMSLIVIVLFVLLGANVGEDNLVNSNWGIISAGTLVAYICSVIVTSVYLLMIISRIPSNRFINTTNKPTTPPGKFR